MITKQNEGDVLDFDWGRITWLVSGAQGNSDTMTFGRVTIKAGQANPVHRHPNCDEILHLLSGQLEHSLNGEKFTLQAGDTISIPTGAWHNAHAVGDEDAVMLIVFSSANRQTESHDGTG
jgi:quercetin dioxygenase-like cupin family protein